MKKMLLFVNPKAGKSEMRTYLMEVINRFTQAGYDVTVHPTQKPKDITEVIARDGEQYDRIVVSGGDGTLNEAVSGMAQLTHPPLLGYLPTGTVNDFAASLEIPRDVLSAAEIVVTGDEFWCDLGMFNDRIFDYVAAFGAFTAVSYETPHAEKQAFGRAAYIMEGIRSLSDIRPYWVKLEHDGVVEEEEVLFGMVTNSVSVGGFRALPDEEGVRLDDGLFEVVLIRKVGSLQDINAVTGALLRRDFSADSFRTFQTDCLTMTFQEPVSWTLDGEYGGTVTVAEIVNQKQSLRILVPKAY